MLDEHWRKAVMFIHIEDQRDIHCRQTQTYKTGSVWDCEISWTGNSGIILRIGITTGY